MNDRLSCRLAALVCAALLVPMGLSSAGSKENNDPVASLRSGIKDVVSDPARALLPYMQLASEQRRNVQRVSFDRMFDLREILTEEEWNAVFANMEEPS